MRRFRGRRRRRRTNWIPGINFGEAVQNASIVFTQIAATTTTGFTVDLSSAADLASSGGEGAVVCRVVGSLHFHNLVRPVTLLPGWIRVALFTRQTAGASIANTGAPDLFSLVGLAQENILWMGQTYVSELDAELTSGSASGNELLFSDYVGGRMEIDAGAKRRLEEDLTLALTLQGQQTQGGVAAPSNVDCSGYLRVLLQHAL